MPFAGALADRYGTARVLAAGGLIYAAAMLMTARAPTPLWLQISLGGMAGLGIAASSFTIVLAAFGRAVTPARRTIAFGVGTAAGSFGQFLFGPLTPVLIDRAGWQGALIAFAAITLLIVPLAYFLRGRSEAAGSGPQLTLGETVRQALAYPSYILLVFGFFVCGFHLAFILAHLPAYLGDLGMAAAVGGWALALIGLFNIVGSLGAGAVGARYSKPYSLAAIYLARSVAIAAFVLTPVTVASVLVFSAVMGLLWLSTVPLTSGLVAVMFGPRYMATLFGIVFFSHQVGSFIGVLLGGIIYARTGSYDILWWIGVLLGVFAALVHLPIKDAPAPRLEALARPA
jgi:MFS family permease